MTTTRQAPDRRVKMIRAIQCGRRMLPQNDDESFAALMRGATGGSDDIKTMTVAELGKVLDAMRKAGFAPKDADKTAALRGRITALWRQMLAAGIVSRSDGYEGYCRRICKRGLESLTVKQCTVVIESLKRWHARATGMQAEAANGAE